MQYPISIFVFEYPKAAQDIWSLQHSLRLKGIALRAALKILAIAHCWQIRTEQALSRLLSAQKASSPALKEAQLWSYRFDPATGKNSSLPHFYLTQRSLKHATSLVLLTLVTWIGLFTFYNHYTLTPWLQ